MSVTRTLAVATVVALVSAPSFAADMTYDRTPTVAAPVPYLYDWTGVYAGVHAGYFWGDMDGSLQVPLGPGPGYGSDVEGFLLGGQVGANWQIHRFVLGLEGDLAWSNADGSGTLGGGGQAVPEMEWFGTIRGRAGIAIDHILVYATGGVAFASIEQTLQGPGVMVSDENSHVGWTVGAGIEAGLTENLSAKVEYLYADFGEEPYNYGPAFAVGLPLHTDLSGHIVRAGLNYRFNLLQ